MRERMVLAVKQALEEFAPEADPQDVREFVDALDGCDFDELEMNIGAGFGQFCPDEASCNAAFERYAELMGGGEVKPNPTRPLLEDL